MTRCVISIPVFSLLICLGAVHLNAAGPVIFEGMITDTSGRPVAGAEVELSDNKGLFKRRVMSHVDGTYQFPPLPDQIPYRISISHLRYKSVSEENVAEGAKPGTSKLSEALAGDPIALLAAAKVLSREFHLAPSNGIPQHPTLGPVDPNRAEYYLRRAHLLLSRGEKKRAVEFFKLYAQLGANPRQIQRAVDLIAIHDTGN